MTTPQQPDHTAQHAPQPTRAAWQAQVMPDTGPAPSWPGTAPQAAAHASAAPAPPGQQRRTASAAPLDELANNHHPVISACGGYLVCPRGAAAMLTMPEQQQLAHLLGLAAHRSATRWPSYHVAAREARPLPHATEQDALVAGYIFELNDNGEAVYRQIGRTKPVDQPEQHQVWHTLPADPVNQPPQQ